MMNSLFCRRFLVLLIAALLLSSLSAMAEIPDDSEMDIPSAMEITTDPIDDIIGPGDDIDITEAPEPILESSMEVDLAEAVEAAEALEEAELSDACLTEITESGDPIEEIDDHDDTVAEAAGQNDPAVFIDEASGVIPIDEAHFPDPNFRKCLSGYDMNEDGVLSGEELDDLSDLNLSNAAYPITDLRGLEYLTPVKYLNCQYTGFTSLDVSCLPNLVYLNCDFSRSLNSLNLGALPALDALSVRCCDSLASVDIGQCPTLLKNIAGRKPKLRKVYWNDQIGKLSYYIWGWDNNEDSHCVYYTANTRIDAGGTTASQNAISVLGKRAKATATVGVPCQIDTGGKKGKKYKSSKKSVASVNASGLIIPRKAGKTKITFKVGKKKRTLTLTVIDPTIPTSVVLNLTGTQAAKAGESVTLTATMNEGAVSGIRWKSSNKKVATVKNGVVKFKKAGKVTITAKCKRGKKKARVKFKVSN